MPENYFKTHTDRVPLTITPEPWMEKALCRQVHPDLHFPEGRQQRTQIRDAKNVCGRCEVAGACLDYALRNNEEWGVWGGLDERELRKLRQGVLGPVRTTKPRPQSPVRSPWSAAEERLALRLEKDGLTKPQIGERLGRTAGAVATRLWELKNT
jgi:hypothetical protein